MANSQVVDTSLVCVTPDNTSTDPLGEYSYAIDFDDISIDLCETKVLDVVFWQINRPDGINDYPNTKVNTLTGIANLNRTLNEFGIYFKYRRFESVNSPEHIWDQDGVGPQGPTVDPDGFYVLEKPDHWGPLKTAMMQEGYYDDNAMNIYIFGYGSFGGVANFLTQMCAISSKNVVRPSLVHEVAHNLNIRHTRSTNEHVTRDINNMNYNADVAGDLVTDTAADPGQHDYSCSCYPDINLFNCTYVGDETDNVGDEYDLSNEDLKNTMTDTYPCIDFYFTEGQGIRMREAIEAGYFDNALTPISELYEPYAGNYINDPLHPDYSPPLFQPGFNYRFLSCSCDCEEPSSYFDTSFGYTTNVVVSFDEDETNYQSITHPNHSAIEIEFPNCGSFNNIRKCWDDNGLAASRGSTTKFNDGQVNGNYTRTEQDSIQINNPYLIETMSPGLYLIEKEYYDGSCEQQMIYKSEE